MCAREQGIYRARKNSSVFQGLRTLNGPKYQVFEKDIHRKKKTVLLELTSAPSRQVRPTFPFQATQSKYRAALSAYFVGYSTTEYKHFQQMQLSINTLAK